MEKKKIGILSAVVFLFCAVGLLFATNAKNSNKGLTEEQINSLRAEYPICYGAPPNVEMMTPTLDKVIDRVDTFVYGRVIGEIIYYYRDISTGNEMLDKKRIENGLSNTYGYYEYTIEVIRDTQNELTSNSQITISQNIEFENYYPVLKEGMEVVVPVTHREGRKATRYSYSTVGFYYVTEDGYVLSAFDEDDPLIFHNTKIDKKSGIQVDTLMKQLKQKKDDMLKAAADTDEVSE